MDLCSGTNMFFMNDKQLHIIEMYDFSRLGEGKVL